MRIGTNMSAIISNRYLSKSEKSLQTSIERLSSGYKINSSKDDSAGMAISEKMKKQIQNLDRASMNASDGISVAQAAEGALNEIHSMLQRMNELAVQGANDTFTDEDRANIESEINALKDEIDRVSEDTEFNNIKLLNGDVQRRSYATVSGGDGEKSLTSGVTATYYTSPVEAGEYGISVNSDGTAEFLTDEDGNRVGFGDSAMITSEDGKVTVTDTNGFQMEFTVEDGFSGDVTVELWDLGTMPIQVGANANQIINIEIPEVSVRTLDLDTLDFSTSDKCGESITVINEAISRVSKVRSDLGACQNRLEYSVTSVDSTKENMTAALSRITDVDMAEEMTNYTQYNVLQQAGVSMVAQANQLPEKVLQLLQ
jgi:flagellin